VPRSSFSRTPIELQRCFATPAALCRPRGLRSVSGRASRAGRFPPPASRTRQDLVAAGSPITRVRLVRVPGLDDGGDRAPSNQDHHWLESPTGDRRSPTGDRRGPRFLRATHRVRTTGRNESSPALPRSFTGPAVPLLSTARAAEPSGRDRRGSRSSVVRTGRVSRKNGTRGREGASARAPARHASPSRRLRRRVRLPLQSSP
jgi:hypothetical protein